MRIKPSLVLLLLAMSALAAQRSHAFELIAWPMAGNSVWRSLLPGTPVNPLPPGHLLPPLPRPMPRPGPGPSPRPVPQPLPVPESSPLTLSGYHVEGTIDDRVATLTYNITFHNPTSQRLEGVLLIPIPADAVLSKFTMMVGGKEAKAELLEAERAANIYQEIVNRRRDPGLLELVGERLIRARVFPIEPGSDIQATIALSQILPKSGELVSLKIPLQSAQMLQGQKGRASVNISLKTSRPIRTLYSPEAGVAISRKGDSAAVISYEEGAQKADGDLNLFYSFQADPLAASLLTFKEEGEDGYFLLSLSPKQDAGSNATPKDIVFIVDRSGSMEDAGKMEQARKALSYCIGRLEATDRFGIVDFATDSNSFESRLVLATPENKARAKRYVSRLEAAGGTNIQAGLEDGMKLLRPAPERMPLMFFLTDGLPTVGATDIPTLLRRAQEQNSALKARLFTFGIGADVNTWLLDKLAEENRGARDYVAPGENIEHKVSILYQKVAKPALGDVALHFDGVEAEQVYPRPITDIFYGGELVVMGRYHGAGKGTLKVTGRSQGKQVTFNYPMEFPKTDARRDFLPRLWASMKVSHELDAIRLSGRADPEVVSEIVKLAKRHGIVTPYTSFLITEEGTNVQAAQNAAMRSVSMLRGDAMQSGFTGGAVRAKAAQRASSFFGAMSGGMGGGMSAAAGPESLDSGTKLGAARGASPAPAANQPSTMLAKAEQEVRESLRLEGRSAAEMRQAAGKTFYKRGGTWVDADAEAEGSAKVPSVSVAYMSPEYFALLQEHPELGKWFALGGSLTVVFHGTTYHVTQ